jgi:hypothetical protein
MYSIVDKCDPYMSHRGLVSINAVWKNYENVAILTSYVTPTGLSFCTFLPADEI